MTLPLMMLGPGGDYVARYEPVGQKLSRRVGQPQGQSDNPDTESGSSMAGYSRMPKRHAQDDSNDHAGDPSHQWAAERDDRFEPSAESNDSADATVNGGETARRWVKAGSLAAAASAVDAWLDRQLIALVESDAGDRLMNDIEALGNRDESEATEATADVVDEPRVAADLADPIDPNEEHAVLRRIALNHRVVSISPTPAGSSDHDDEDEHLTLPGLNEAHHSEQDHDTQTHAQTAEDPAAHPRLAADQGLFPDLAGAGRRARRQQGHRVRARAGAHQKGSAQPGSQQIPLFGAHR